MRYCPPEMLGTRHRIMFPSIMILVPWTAKVIARFEASSEGQDALTVNSVWHARTSSWLWESHIAHVLQVYTPPIDRPDS
jgi:hypothetical protein